MVFLMHPYAQKRSQGVYIVSTLFMGIGRWVCDHREAAWGQEAPLTPFPCLCPLGVFSMYFHMTLSFLGQLLDELAILWLLAFSYSIWMPRCYFPAFLKGNRWAGAGCADRVGLEPSVGSACPPTLHPLPFGGL
jgi:alkaline ceramidase